MPARNDEQARRGARSAPTSPLHLSKAAVAVSLSPSISRQREQPPIALAVGADAPHRAGRRPGSEAEARTFVCARMPEPPRRLDAPDVMSQRLGRGDLRAGATSTRAMVMVTTPAGLPRPVRSRF